MATITVEVPELLAAHLRALAAIEGLTVQLLAEIALANYRDARSTNEYASLADHLNTSDAKAFVEFVRTDLRR